MSEQPVAELSCQSFLEQLEQLPLESLGDARENLAPQAREHVTSCASCQAALQDFLDTRQALLPMRGTLHQPSPWFVSRVMAVIKEREEQADSVWISVMRLAPRISAFAALLLVFGGTWAMQLHRAQHSREQQPPSVEGLFETAPSTPPNDDIVALNTHEEVQP
jgi:hypothetical protein